MKVETPVTASVLLNVAAPVTESVPAVSIFPLEPVVVALPLTKTLPVRDWVVDEA